MLCPAGGAQSGRRGEAAQRRSVLGLRQASQLQGSHQVPSARLEVAGRADRLGRRSCQHQPWRLMDLEATGRREAIG
jgi:hypothetical protein